MSDELVPCFFIEKIMIHYLALPPPLILDDFLHINIL